jgi:hypothetical protein
MPSSPDTLVAAKKELKKKKPHAKLNPEVTKARREAIEKRIMKLEGKLNKDRTLLLRYAPAEETEK